MIKFSYQNKLKEFVNFQKIGIKLFTPKIKNIFKKNWEGISVAKKIEKKIELQNFISIIHAHTHTHICAHAHTHTHIYLLFWDRKFYSTD